MLFAGQVRLCFVRRNSGDASPSLSFSFSFSPIYLFFSYLSPPLGRPYSSPFPLSLWGVRRGKVPACHTVVYHTWLLCFAMVAAQTGGFIVRRRGLYMRILNSPSRIHDRHLHPVRAVGLRCVTFQEIRVARDSSRQNSTSVNPRAWVRSAIIIRRLM